VVQITAPPITITVTTGPPSGNANIDGQVYYNLFGQKIPIPNAKVTLDTQETTTSNLGKFIFTAPLGNYTLKIDHFLFETFQESLSLTQEIIYPVEADLTLKFYIKIAAVGIPSAIILVALVPKR
jgi:hypothetical protein